MLEAVQGYALQNPTAALVKDNWTMSTIFRSGGRCVNIVINGHHGIKLKQRDNLQSGRAPLLLVSSKRL